MSIEGKLNIQLTPREEGIHCHITSSRPLQASQVFIGKPIETVIKTLPMLFNICGKAQTIATLRAYESLTNCTITPEINQQREALVYLESLREHLWKIIIDWAMYLQEPANAKLLSTLTQLINGLSQSINHNGTLLTTTPLYQKRDNTAHWQTLKALLENELLASQHKKWLEDDVDIKKGYEKQTSQTARFILWLEQTVGKTVGTSSTPYLQQWDDKLLQQRLDAEQYTFTATPDWQGTPQEVSWFSSLVDIPPVTSLLKHYGNSVYTRMITRLVSIADLIKKLDDFFEGSSATFKPMASNGIAHIHAARGRLSHHLQVEGNQVKQLSILAPTEWNFHPQGVVTRGLENLTAKTTDQLRLHATLLIDAIDPCVGYQLEIINNA